MGDTDSLFQLIFFVVIAVAWAIKGILEARRQKQQPRRRPTPVESDGGTPDVTVRRPPLRPQPTPATPMSRELGGVAERHLVGGRRLLRSSRAATAHGAVVLKKRRTSAYRRLSGGANVAPGPDLARAGILWSEILGPCRALRGPHRPPHVQRRGG